MNVSSLSVPGGGLPGTVAGVPVKPGAGSSSSGGDVGTLDYVLADGKTCRKSSIGTKEGSGCDPKDLNDEAARLQAELDKETDDHAKAAKAAELAKVLARLQDLKQYGTLGVSALAAVVRILETDEYKGKSDAQKLAFWSGTNYKLATGKWNALDLKKKAQEFEDADKRKSSLPVAAGSVIPQNLWNSPGSYPPPPPGYDPKTWKVAQWDNGKWVLIDPDGNEYTAHQEDEGHWRHWDKKTPDGKEERVPNNSKKPRANQKKGRGKNGQSETDPSGNEPGWNPPETSNPSVSNPIIIIPAPFPVTVPIPTPMPIFPIPVIP